VHGAWDDFWMEPRQFNMYIYIYTYICIYVYMYICI
jgi:hypothetical protein